LAEPRADALDAATLGRSGIRILVADDNADSVTTLSWSLVHDGHDVRTATDGLKAVEVALDFRPQLAILDIGMPHLNGYEAARRIRDALGPSVTLVAVTGWGQDDDRHRSREAGFDRHVTKPLDHAMLERLIAEVGQPDPT
jgi:CheY-like chemotaxis protein